MSTTAKDVAALFGPKPIVYVLGDGFGGYLFGAERLENGQQIFAMSRALLHRVDAELTQSRRQRLSELADVRYAAIQSGDRVHVAVQTNGGYEDRPVLFAEIR